MNKILKILSILVISFVMFSCSTPTNDPTPYIPEPSGPETPVETPSDDPVEETPAVQTYSITFVAEKDPIWDKPVAELLNSLSAYKNLEKGAERKLPTIVYAINGGEEYVIEEPEPELYISYNKCVVHYENNVTSVIVGNEDVEIKFWTENADK